MAGPIPAASFHLPEWFPEMAKQLIIMLMMTCAFMGVAAPCARAGDDAIDGLFQALAKGDDISRRSILIELASTGDERLDGFFEAYRMGTAFIWNDTMVMTSAEPGQNLRLIHPLTGLPVLNEHKLPVTVKKSDLTSVRISRDERKLVVNARSLLRLSSPNSESRLAGAKKCGDPPVLVDAVSKLEQLSASDPDRTIRRVAGESLWLIRLDIADDGSPEQLDAVGKLTALRSIRAVPRLQELAAVKPGGASSLSTLQTACLDGIRIIERRIFLLDRISYLFQGLSLGSVLILMALGLAITFGLMGVINMAHGEMMMIGAYTTYEIQRLFASLIASGHLGAGMQDWYFLAALPAAFVVSAVAGYIMELLVVRHLYRRPLESLLATWGVGLILIQAVRLRYGDNIGVNAPSWARGGIEVLPDLTLPYGRLFIIAVCAVCLLAVHLLIQKSPLGLRMRATMQNRDMAGALGVNTSRVDRATFALGSGLAGIAGYAWTLIGGVTPDMGQQNFIIDSFLVVVTGGVGEIFGVVCAGMGIGVLTKFFEPLQIGTFTFGAIWAKVALLILIVTFIQFKPAGIFAPKGRLADA